MPFLRTFIRHPREEEQGAVVRSFPGLPINAKTLGEALVIAEEYFGVRIKPHNERDWFRIYGMPGAVRDYLVVGINIFRDRDRICVNQDLSFPLLDSDRVSISVLAGMGLSADSSLEPLAK
jgi:hypothetical protein